MIKGIIIARYYVLTAILVALSTQQSAQELPVQNSNS
jgi:hypothetical protein